MKNAHLMPNFSDSMSYLYLEHCKVDKEDNSIAAHDNEGKTSIPCASLSVILLGPGTSITHAAVKSIADNGCSVVWCGEEGVRFYAQAWPDTKSAKNILKQAFLQVIPELRMKVVRKMYEKRFLEKTPEDMTLRQLRGKEGSRVKEIYANLSKETGVEWNGRNYKFSDWGESDTINRAISWANACLYALVHAGIVTLGYSTALGFIHVGKQLSFVYDIADLYKMDTVVPVAFQAVADNPDNLEHEIRRRCRMAFKENKILEKIVKDIEELMNIEGNDADKKLREMCEDGAGYLWEGFSTITEAGKKWEE
jgi:CRISPR-associated protein Cas1